MTAHRDPIDESGVYTSTQLADRWGITRAWVHQLRGPGSPLAHPLPDGRRVGSGQSAAMVWTGRQITDFEAANPEWVEASEQRRASNRGRRPAQPDG